MNKIEFVSHMSFPADEYTKELVYLCLDGKYRIAYVRKASKNGGLFWSVATIGVTCPHGKEYFPAFLQDSNFLEKDIKDFLERRSWERGQVQQQASAFQPQELNNYDHSENQCPF